MKIKIPDQIVVMSFAFEGNRAYFPIPHTKVGFKDCVLAPHLYKKMVEDNCCLVRHPNLPAFATLGVVSDVEQGKDGVFSLSIHLVTRVRIKKILNLKDYANQAIATEFEILRDEKMSTKEFREDYCRKLRLMLITVYGRVWEAVEGEKDFDVMKEMASITDSDSLSEFIDGASQRLNAFGANPRVFEALSGILMATNVFRRLEKTLEIYSWIWLLTANEVTPRQEGELVPALVLQKQGAKSAEGSADVSSTSSDSELPAHIQEIIKGELARLEHATGGETGVIETRIDWLRKLPWNKSSEETKDLRRAKEILDEDHYGLEIPKQRILEHLAVSIINPSAKGRILCFVGPPGVGKTSLGKSIARALGRKFVRASFGAVRDEADIRGHRRTYIGAFPGRIMAGLKEAGVNNPVFMLDEVDKTGEDVRGNPQDALLEVLDPEQNHAFVDHYLDVSFDLSKVLFIATANAEDPIHPALLDRMHIVKLPGYSEDEKVHIAEQFLIPKQLQACGLTSAQLEAQGIKPLAVQIGEESLRAMIRDYTHEAGVRRLERQCLETVFSKIAFALCEKSLLPEISPVLVIAPGDLEQYLGPPKVFSEMRDLAKLKPGAGVFLSVDGWGQGSLGFIEVSRRPNHKFDRTITGNLALVIEQSVKVAMSRILHHDILPQSLRDEALKSFFHIHFDEEAIPKDGPSAGVMTFLTIISNLIDIPIKPLFAGTGEIMLDRDIIGPIGGVREKLLAAERAGMKEIFIPRGNETDLHALPDAFRKKLRIVLPDEMGRVVVPEDQPSGTLTIYCLDTPEQAYALAFPSNAV